MIKIQKPWDGAHDQVVSAGNGGVYKINDLIDLSKDLPVMQIPLDHLCITRSFGTSDIRDFVSHMNAVMDSDLKYPIILCENGGILDGAHRVCKALHLGKKTIKAVRFESNPPPSFYEDSD